MPDSLANLEIFWDKKDALGEAAPTLVPAYQQPKIFFDLPLKTKH
jgi:hypothetical protein